VDDERRELLRNGSFGKDMDFWLFSSDKHLPMAPGKHLTPARLRTACSGWPRSARAARRGRAGKPPAAGDPYAPALAAALAVFLAPSRLDSLFDFPGIGMLIYPIPFHALSHANKAMLQGIIQ
jgi:hypothetical protein